jgi:hypothetical protein
MKPLKGKVMTNIELNSNQQNRTLTQWLFNPFQFVAGSSALLVGLVIMLASAYLGSLSNSHFDGVLDLHIGKAAPLWIFLAEVVVDWLCISITLLIAGFIVSRTSFRIVDVFGTQALARAPYLLSVLVLMPKGFIRFTKYLVSKLTQQAPMEAIKNTDVLFFAAGVIVAILMIVWMIALIYRAYTVSCNTKGGKAIGSFIAALIVAEILSKIAILTMLQLAL